MMDIRNYMRRTHSNDDLNPQVKEIKSPQKKAKRVVNSTGTNYEETDYMVCSVCIKIFKTLNKYVSHMEDHQNKLSLSNYSIMKVFKEVTEDEATKIHPEHHYKATEEPQISSSAPAVISSSSSIIENDGDHFSTAQAIIKLGLPETLGVTIKNLATTIKSIDISKNLKGITNMTLTMEEFRCAIKSMSNNIRDQLLKRVLQSPYFTLHLAEFLDIRNFKTLIVTIRYKYDCRIQEEILFCQQLDGSSADEIYLVASNFMTTYQLDWKNCVGISMDRIRAECEPLNIFTELIFISGIAPSSTYTFSRRGSFIENHMPEILAETLRDAVAIVNILKRNTTLKFDQYMEDGYQQIFYHTDYYWLSYGRLLSRLFEMRDQCKTIPEIICFKDDLDDTNWLHKLAYVSDIFECFNRLNRDLQIKQFSMFHVYDKITFIVDLLKMYRTNVEQHNFTQFSNLQQLLMKEPQRNVHPDILSAILKNLRCLENNMNRYLPIASEIENCAWIRNPFEVSPDKMPRSLSTSEKEMLLNLRKDGFILAKFDEEKLDYFWASAEKNYPDLAIKAMKHLLIFKNSMLSEIGFACLVDIRTKMLTDLEYEEFYVRLKLSNIEPDLKTL